MTDLAALAVASIQRVVVSAAAYLYGQKLCDLSLTGGSITADSRRGIMRDASLDIAPTDAQSIDTLFGILATPGVELTASRGFIAPDGSEVWAPLGRFVPDEPEEKTGADGSSLSVSCSDVSVRIRRARWTDPYVIAAGQSVADALTALILDRYPQAQTRITQVQAPQAVTAQIVTECGDSSDPWADACALAAAYGLALYPDTSGVITVRPLLDANATNAMFTFASGEAAIITERTRSTSLDTVYNGVIACGEGSDLDTPVRGEAWDERPQSPTYYLGAFGKVPQFYSSPLLTDEAMCEQAARSMLAGVLGRSERLSWSSAVHPGLQPLDVVGVEQADGSTAYYVLDSLTIPLGIADTMSASAREVLVSW